MLAGVFAGEAVRRRRRGVTDTRRVCDLTPLELFEAGFAQLASIGVTRGVWDATFRLEDGHVRRVRPKLAQQESQSTIGRRQLGELGSAA